MSFAKSDSPKKSRISPTPSGCFSRLQKKITYIKKSYNALANYSGTDILKIKGSWRFIRYLTFILVSWIKINKVATTGEIWKEIF